MSRTAAIYSVVCSLRASARFAMAAKKYEQLCSDFAPKINEKIETFESGATDAIQAFGYELRKLLLDNDLAYHEVVHYDSVGVDIDNRDGEMLTPFKVHSLLALIARKGWNWHETQQALAREQTRNDDIAKLYLEKNEQMISRSDGLLAPCHVELLRIFTGAGSHTTAMLRIAAHADGTNIKSCSGVDDHLGKNGYLCKSRILEVCPTLAEPLKTGIRYFIVRWQVADACPKLMRILSEADNAKHDNNQKESQLQTMLNVHRRALELGASTDDDFKDVAKRVARGHGPEFTHDVACYCDFVRQYSGGPSKPFLVDLHDFTKTLKVERAVHPEFFRDVSKVDFVQGASYMLALVKASVASPEQYVKFGKARIFSHCDIASVIGALNSQAMNAVRIMTEARDLACQMDIHDTAAWARIKGQLDVRLVMHIHNKQAANRRSFKSIREIAQQCYEDLVKEFGQKAKDVQSPWIDIPLAAAAAKPAKAQSGLRSLNVRGAVTTEIINQMGIAEGCIIKNKEGVVATVAAIHDAECTVEITKLDGDIAQIPFDAMVAYHVYEPPQVQYHDLSTISPIDSYEWMAELARSRVRVALQAAYAKHRSSEKLVKIITEPTKGVVCAQKVKEGQIKLIPLSTSVQLCGTVGSSNMVPLGFTLFQHGSKGDVTGGILAPRMNFAKGAEFVVPFWMLRTTPDASEANMHLVACSLIGDIPSIPMYTNRCSLEEGAELMVHKPLKRSSANDIAEPSSKCARTSSSSAAVAAKAKAKPNTKAKAKK